MYIHLLIKRKFNSSKLQSKFLLKSVSVKVVKASGQCSFLRKEIKGCRKGKEIQNRGWSFQSSLTFNMNHELEDILSLPHFPADINLVAHKNFSKAPVLVHQQLVHKSSTVSNDF